MNMMESVSMLLAFFAVGFLGVVYWTWKRTKSNKGDERLIVEWMKSMQVSIDNTARLMHEAIKGNSGEVTRVLNENSRVLTQRLDYAAELMTHLQRNMGEMSEVGKGIKSLQEFLGSPKMRGNIGEQVLYEMLGENFPKNSLFLQHEFKSGVKVDAAIKTDAGLLCIDSKFPMENFTLMVKGESEEIRERAKKNFATDIKGHINSIARKYIVPGEGTMDFALMYIPSESVYYEVVNIDELTNLARKTRVYPVSPNTLYAHLQVLMLSFQGREMESKSREVISLIRALRKDYEKIEESMGVLNKHINNAHNQAGQLSGNLEMMGQKLTRSIELESKSEEVLTD